MPNREINRPTHRLQLNKGNTTSRRAHLLAGLGLFFFLSLNGRDAHLQLASVAVDGSALHLTGARLGDP